MRALQSKDVHDAGDSHLLKFWRNKRGVDSDRGLSSPLEREWARGGRAALAP
jgi:hypothetical protein